MVFCGVRLPEVGVSEIRKPQVAQAHGVIAGPDRNFWPRCLAAHGFYMRNNHASGL
jgi:hypothetical protein